MTLASGPPILSAYCHLLQPPEKNKHRVHEVAAVDRRNPV